MKKWPKEPFNESQSCLYLGFNPMWIMGNINDMKFISDSCFQKKPFLYLYLQHSWDFDLRGGQLYQAFLQGSMVDCYSSHFHFMQLSTRNIRKSAWKKPATDEIYTNCLVIRICLDKQKGPYHIHLQCPITQPLVFIIICGAGAGPHTCQTSAIPLSYMCSLLFFFLYKIKKKKVYQGFSG